MAVLNRTSGSPSDAHTKAIGQQSQSTLASMAPFFPRDNRSRRRSECDCPLSFQRLNFQHTQVAQNSSTSHILR